MCASCSGGVCTKCFDNQRAVYNSDNEITECQDIPKQTIVKQGYFFDDLLKVFRPCNKGCLDCSGGQDRCTTCSPEYKLMTVPELSDSSSFYTTCVCNDLGSRTESDGTCITGAVKSDPNCFIEIG
jgi:hypothetical protein